VLAFNLFGQQGLTWQIRLPLPIFETPQPDPCSSGPPSETPQSQLLSKSATSMGQRAEVKELQILQRVILAYDATDIHIVLRSTSATTHHVLICTPSSVNLESTNRKACIVRRAR
jgi:hypothetical protein